MDGPPRVGASRTTPGDTGARRDDLVAALVVERWAPLTSRQSADSPGVITERRRILNEAMAGAR